MEFVLRDFCFAWRVSLFLVWCPIVFLAWILSLVSEDSPLEFCFLVELFEFDLWHLVF